MLYSKGVEHDSTIGIGGTGTIRSVIQIDAAPVDPNNDCRTDLLLSILREFCLRTLLSSPIFAARCY
jgi:hypothetical protein